MAGVNRQQQAVIGQCVRKRRAYLPGLVDEVVHVPRSEEDDVLGVGVLEARDEGDSLVEEDGSDLHRDLVDV